jgi:hypothetical protein
MEAASIAVFDLGLSIEEWLDSTPRWVHALRLRQEQKMQREELLVGIISAAVSDSGFREWTPRRTPESFMIHPFPPQPERLITLEDMKAVAAAFPQLQFTVEDHSE